MKKTTQHPPFARRDTVRIIQQTDSFIVVYKPPGILSQSDRTGDRDLLSIVKGLIHSNSSEKTPFLGLVHRLDRPAAGLVVLAKTSEAAADLSKQFRHHTIKKEYLAVVHGRTDPSGSMHDHLIKNHETVISRTAESDESGARESSLRFTTIDSRLDRSLVRIQLETGRSHQIRVQFSSRGFPIVGDRKYGSREVLRDPGMIALWADRLSLKDPSLRQIMKFESPRPLYWPWHAS